MHLFISNTLLLPLVLPYLYCNDCNDGNVDDVSDRNPGRGQSVRRRVDSPAPEQDLQRHAPTNTVLLRRVDVETEESRSSANRSTFGARAEVYCTACAC